MSEEGVGSWEEGVGGGGGQEAPKGFLTQIISCQ